MTRVTIGIVAAAMLIASQASAVAPVVGATDRSWSAQGLAFNDFAVRSPAAIAIVFALLAVAFGSLVADQDHTPNSP